MSFFDVQQSSLVIVGAWNPSIVTPNWLKQQFPELIKDPEYSAELVGGVGVRFTIEKILIDPSGGRLVLMPRTNDAAALDVIAKLALGILGRLSHTPISAVGHNFTFRMETSERLLIDDYVKNASMAKFYQSIALQLSPSVEVKHSFQRANHQLNITHEISSETKVIRFNYHYTVHQERPVREAVTELQSNRLEANELSLKLIRRKNS